MKRLAALLLLGFASVALAANYVGFKVSTSNPITMSLSASRSSGTGPLLVVFDATGTTAASLTSFPIHEIQYTWDFGDTANPNAAWAYGTRTATGSKNVASGPVGAHVYETAGSFSACVTAQYSGTTNSTCTTITVADPDTTFSGTNTICLANGSAPVAGVGGCPTGAQVAGSVTSWATVLGTYVAANKRVLLKAGDTFNGHGSISNKSIGTVGAYPIGSSAKITDSSPAAFTCMLTLSNTVSDWRLMDLEFDGQSNVGTCAIQLGAAWTKILVLRANMHHTSSGIESDFAGATVLPDQFGFVDSQLVNRTCDLSTFSTGYHSGAQNHAIMGSNFDGQSGCFHNVRINWAIIGVFSNNQVARGPTSGQELWTLRAVCSTSTCPGSEINLALLSGSAAATRYNYIAENFFVGTSNAGGVTLQQVNSGDSALFNNNIIERNFLTASGTGKIGINAAGTEITVRGNVWNLTGATAGENILTFPAASGPLPATTNGWGYNNTIYGGTLNYTATVIACGASTTGNISNNLGWFPSSTSVTAFVATCSGFTKATNSSLAQVKSSGTDPQFSTTATTVPLASTDFKPTNATYPISGGTAVPVWSDLFGTAWSPTWSIGAVHP